MSMIQAETTSSDLVQRINTLFTTSPRHVAKDDFEYRRVLRDCESLIKADALAGYLVLSLAHVLTADLENVEKNIAKAKALAGADSSGRCDFMLSQALLKLGYFSRAQKLFISSSGPESGRFGYRSRIGLVVGAMIGLTAMFQEADAMTLKYDSSVDREGVESLSSVMVDAGVTDEDLAGMMDYLGVVARRHRLHIHRQDIGVRNLDGESFVHVEAKVNCPPSEAAEMIYEVAELVSEAERVPPAIHVSFGVE